MKKDWIVEQLNADSCRAGYCGTMVIYDQYTRSSYSSYADAEKSASKKAGDNIKGSYGVYELVSVVEAPAPKVEITKV